MTARHRRGRVLRGIATITLVAATSGPIGAAGAAGAADDSGADTTASDDTAGDGERFAPRPLAEPAEITVSLPLRIEPFTHFLLAEALGEFERENLTVTFEQIPAADALPLLASGDIDASATSFNAAVVNAIASGIDMRVVLEIGGSPEGTQGIWVVNDVLEQGPAALEGRDVGSATGAGSVGSLHLDEWLQSGGLSIADVNLVQMPPADIPQAMENGALDAAFVTSPGYLQVEDFATWVAGPPADAPGGVILFGPRLRDEEREVGEAFVRAVLRTIDQHLMGDYKTDEETVELVAEALEIEADVVLATPSLDFEHLLDGADAETITAMQEVWLLEPEVMQVDEPLPFEEIVDETLLEDVVAAG